LKQKIEAVSTDKYTDSAEEVERGMSPAALLRLPAVERERPVRKRLLSGEDVVRYMLWMFSLMCVVFYISVSSWAYGQVDVPDIVGLDRDDAIATLAGIGLQGDVTGIRVSEYPEGEVIGQTPQEGERLYRDAVVELIVSSGPEGVELPTLIGEDQNDARSELERLGVRVLIIPIPSLDVEGTVLLMTPPSGTRIYDADDDVTVTLYAASRIASVGLQEFQLNGLRVAIEPRYATTRAGDVSFDVARRLSSLFEAANAEVDILRDSRERDIGTDEFERRAGLAGPELHIILSVNSNASDGGLVVRSASQEGNSTGYLIYDRMVDNHLEADFQSVRAFGQAGDRNTVHIVLGSSADLEDVENFESTLWRDHVARAIYMAASPQFDLGLDLGR